LHALRFCSSNDVHMLSMTRFTFACAAIACAVAAIPLPTASACAETRVALLIENSAYANDPQVSRIGALHLRCQSDSSPFSSPPEAGTGGLPVEAPRSPSAATPGPGPQGAAVTAQKAVLYEEDPANSIGQRFSGSVLWRTEHVTPRSGQPAELAIRAYVEVPERKLAMTWSLRSNTDKSLPATHVVEITFKLPPNFPPGGISRVPGILAKAAEQIRGTPLAGLAVNVRAGSFLIGLSSSDADKTRNLELLGAREWFDIAIIYSNNRRAILAFEKGDPGRRVFAEAFKAWDQQAAEK